jgi:hypothetical protein
MRSLGSSTGARISEGVTTNEVKAKIGALVNRVESSKLGRRPAVGDFPKNWQFQHNNFNYPVRINEQCAIWDFGTINSSGSFHTERYIYPVGFRIVRPFPSLADPEKEEPWVAEIVEQDGKPLFRAWPESDPSRVFSGTSTAAPFVAAAQEMNLQSQISGPSMFLLDNLDVVYDIQHLVRVSKCKGYITRDIIRDERTGGIAVEGWSQANEDVLESDATKAKEKPKEKGRKQGKEGRRKYVRKTEEEKGRKKTEEKKSKKKAEGKESSPK